MKGGTASEVFLAFLKLGLTSFGGPIAHLGYFRDEFVTRRGWLDDRAYADLVALCQFLPGPASSQVGFGLGLMRAGTMGAILAWIGFTLPSAILMTAIALGAASLDDPIAQGVFHGLKLVAVAVVAQAVLGMARTLTPDKARAAIAVMAVVIMVVTGSFFGQLAAILTGGLFGLLGLRNDAADVAPTTEAGVSRTIGLTALAIFLLLLVLLPLAASFEPGFALADVFYRAGAFVFGGGHVVLPLLEAGTVGQDWLSEDTFLAGYGAAQAMPGPLFTFAAYLGAASAPATGIVSALVALVAIFLPGILLLVAALPFWARMRTDPAMQAAMRGANAAVVGILALALYDPVFTSAVRSPVDFALALAGFVALVSWRLPPLYVVFALAGISGGLSYL